MALDTTVAGASADAYISVAEADAFAAQRVGDPSWVTAWTALTTTAKENAIRAATIDVDVHVRFTEPWSSAAYQPVPPPTAQRLAFPRSADYTGTAPGTPYIDRLVQQATFEQAIFRVVTSRLLDDAAKRQARGMFQFDETDGPSGTLSTDPTRGRFSPAATHLLRSLTGTGSAGVRSVPIRSLGYQEPIEVLS